MAENVRGGAGRKEEVGDGDRPIITPGEINSGSTGTGSASQQDDDPRTITRESGLDSETDTPENDALGG